MDERVRFQRYGMEGDCSTFYESIHFPNYGTMAITYESRPGQPARPVIQFNFDPIEIRVIDQRGNDRLIET